MSKDTNSRNIIVRRKPNAQDNLTDSQKVTALDLYKQGAPIDYIADELKSTRGIITTFINKTYESMAMVKEVNQQLGRGAFIARSGSSSSSMTEDFMDLVEDRMDAYAYYYGVTGSNEYALKEAGLDVGLRKVSPETRKFAIRARGSYLRAIPRVHKYIEELREANLKKSKVGKPFIQSELVEQISQLKELAEENSRYRSQLLKAIELLGRSVGAFEDKLKVEDATTKSSIELLMEKAKDEVYEMEKTEDD